MRKSLGKVVLAVIIAGLLTGGIAIASAATKVRTVTTPQGTSVDVISVTGTVTEVSTPTTTESGKGFMGMFRRGPEGTAKIKDSADGTVYTLEFGREAAAGISMKVGDTVTVEGTSETRNSANVLQIWTFTGADGKTVTLRGLDGMGCGRGIQGESVTISGTVTEVTQATATNPSTDDATRPIPQAMMTIKVKQADSTVLTVLIGRDASSITVKVGDAVRIEGFKTSTDATTIMATSFTGADGKTVTLGGKGFGGCGVPGDRGDGQGIGRGFRGGMMGPGSAPDCATPSST